MNQEHHDHNDEHHDHSHIFTLVEGLRIGFVFITLLLSWMPLWTQFVPFKYVGFIAALIGGYPIFKEAFLSLSERKMTMELSMTIALIAALAIGEVFTALVIILFVLIAEVLEGLTIERGRRAIRSLLDLMPKDAFIRQQNGEKKTSIEAIKAGDTVIVKPGSRIPIDGIVIRGMTFVDQSAITGESMPVEKIAGSEVYAGSINQSGAIDVKTQRIGKDTAFGRIIQAVEAAEKSRAPIQRTADRLAGYLVYFAIGAAILTYVFTHDIRSTISVIIVAGACGVAAGTPLALLGAIGRAAAKGVIIKGGLYIEALSKVDTIVFDKTGTLTYGTPSVVEVCPMPGITERAVFEAAAIAERLSEHSIARAILQKAIEQNLAIIEPEHFDYKPGKGIICWSNQEKIIVGNLALFQDELIDISGLKPGQNYLSEVFVARNNQLLGVIRIADIIRKEAREAISELKRMGLNTILLTGDTLTIAQEIGNQLGVAKVEAELLPEQKAIRIRELMLANAKIAMVGDGINDAPALIEASVGVAMGTGTDVARESADIVLLGNDLFKFVETVGIARRCYKIIMANFAGTLLVDTVGILLAAFGYLNPPVAAFIHVSSELIFIMNSARLLPKLRTKNKAQIKNVILNPI
ncbi:heavy metal translocating P-type ATPase [Legionella taurinensis]|uniref:heavy metal translocating P-type ATPase n=1 Tax=Legionella taurinensis TaxID=70611 RepID=UPI001A1F15DB|nr:cation-translocating P-type ATPase [Legionella taurinensis]MDX1838167.1 cation-translocating P-type ATPase [Legionella taurinensis]HAU1025092.1 cation-translocating P-type ATPase [Legionella pneumophila]